MHFDKVIMLKIAALTTLLAVYTKAMGHGHNAGEAGEAHGEAAEPEIPMCDQSQASVTLAGLDEATQVACGEIIALAAQGEEATDEQTFACYSNIPVELGYDPIWNCYWDENSKELGQTILSIWEDVNLCDKEAGMKVLATYPVELQQTCGKLIAASAAGENLPLDDPLYTACFKPISYEDGTNMDLMNCYWDATSLDKMVNLWWRANTCDQAELMEVLGGLPASTQEACGVLIALEDTEPTDEQVAACFNKDATPKEVADAANMDCYWDNTSELTMAATWYSVNQCDLASKTCEDEGEVDGTTDGTTDGTNDESESSASSLYCGATAVLATIFAFAL